MLGAGHRKVNFIWSLSSRNWPSKEVRSDGTASRSQSNNKLLLGTVGLKENQIWGKVREDKV